MLFLTTVPRFNRAMADQQTGLSDLRRVTYELVPGVGLSRHESRLPQGDGVWDESTPPEILAQEVVDLQFRYFDATQGQWLTSWDGTSGGPPQAVEITMAILPPDESSLAPPRPPTSYRTVVAIPTATVPPESSLRREGRHETSNKCSPLAERVGASTRSASGLHSGSQPAGRVSSCWRCWWWWPSWPWWATGFST